MLHDALGSESRYWSFGQRVSDLNEIAIPWQDLILDERAAML